MLPGWKQQVLVLPWRTDDRLMVMMMERESLAYRGELDGGVESRGVQESTFHHELMQVTLAYSTVRHDDDGGRVR